jgi:hypothetical protein
MRGKGRGALQKYLDVIPAKAGIQTARAMKRGGSLDSGLWERLG